MTATLGGLIKDYRLKKRLSQIDVSLKMGWKDTSRLSKIEQGRVNKPNRDTTERIMDALSLNEQERGNFLLIGGYLPTEKEIKDIIKDTKDKIDTWSYPAYLMDFSFRGLYTNGHTLSALNIDPSQTKWFERNKPNFLFFPFLSKNEISVNIMKGEDENNLQDFEIAQIATFKTESEQYQNETWYKNTIKDAMKFEKFRKLWPTVGKENYHKKLYDYEFKTMEGIHNGKKINLKFHLSTGKVICDPRFQLVLYFPANKETEEVFAHLNKK